MRVAVTEGRGHLADPLVRSLLARGHEIVRLTRGGPRATDGPGGPVVARAWDLETGRISGPGLDDVDAVINLHGTTTARRWTPNVREDVRASRITSTLTVVSALEPEGRCQRLLNLSSTAFYGDSGTERVATESPVGRDWLARVVADWEGAARHSPVPTVLLRTPHVLTRSGGYLAARSGWLAGRLGTGRQFVPWIHIDDWTAAVELLLATHVEGPANIVAPEPVTESQFVAERARASGRRAGLPVPDWLLDARFGRDAANAVWRASIRARPGVVLEQGFTHRFGCLADALADVLHA